MRTIISKPMPKPAAKKIRKAKQDGKKKTVMSYASGS